MTRYLLKFRVGTSDKSIYIRFQEEIRTLIMSCHMDEIDYELTQAARKEEE